MWDISHDRKTKEHSPGCHLSRFMCQERNLLEILELCHCICIDMFVYSNVKRLEHREEDFPCDTSFFIRFMSSTSAKLPSSLEYDGFPMCLSNVSLKLQSILCKSRCWSMCKCHGA